MPTYKYFGIQTAIALPPEKEGEPAKEVQLIPHAEVELPADLPYVQRLVSKSLLVPVATSAKKTRKEADS